MLIEIVLGIFVLLCLWSIPAAFYIGMRYGAAKVAADVAGRIRSGELTPNPDGVLE